MWGLSHYNTSIQLLKEKEEKKEGFGDWRSCICDRRTKRLSLLNPPFPLHIFPIIVSSEGFQAHTKNVFPLKFVFCLPCAYPLSLPFSIFQVAVSVSFCATFPVYFALSDPQRPQCTHNSIKDFNPPRGSCGPRSQRVTETLRGHGGTNDRQSLQASHQIHRWAQIKESKLWRSSVPPSQYSNVALGCFATMTAAAHKVHGFLYVWHWNAQFYWNWLHCCNRLP